MAHRHIEPKTQLLPLANFCRAHPSQRACSLYFVNRPNIHIAHIPSANLPHLHSLKSVLSFVEFFDMKNEQGERMRRARNEVTNPDLCPQSSTRPRSQRKPGKGSSCITFCHIISYNRMSSARIRDKHSVCRFRPFVAYSTTLPSICSTLIEHKQTRKNTPHHSPGHPMLNTHNMQPSHSAQLPSRQSFACKPVPLEHI